MLPPPIPRPQIRPHDPDAIELEAARIDALASAYERYATARERVAEAEERITAAMTARKPAAAAILSTQERPPVAARPLGYPPARQRDRARAAAAGA